MECRAILALLQSERDERGWVGHEARDWTADARASNLESLLQDVL